MGRFVKWVVDLESSALWSERDVVFRTGFWLVKEAEWRVEGRNDIDPTTRARVHVPRGAVLASVSEVARRLQRARGTVRGAIDRLEAIEFLRRTEPDGHLMLIVNYDRYNPPGRKVPLKGGNPDNSGDRGGGQELTGDWSKIDQGGGQELTRGVVKILPPALYTRSEPLERTEVLEHSGDKSPRPSPEQDVKPLKLTHPTPPRPRVPKRDIDAVVAAYVAAVDDRLGFRPQLGRREYKHARDLVVRYGAEHAAELAGAYPRLDDAWLHRQGFPLDLLAQRVNAVEVLLRGNGPRRRRDPLDIVTDPLDPVWDEEL